MSVSHRYRDFGEKTARAPEAGPVADAAAIEEQKLQSFEAGYQAGWDDAVKAQADDRARIGAEFGQCLQEMSFTYHEAVTKLSAAFEPVLAGIVEKLLPAAGRDLLAAHVADAAQALVDATLAQPVDIVVAPANTDRIEELCEAGLEAPFRVVADPDLSEEEAFVRVGSREKHVDLGAILAGITAASAAFFHEIKERKDHG